ncbi:carbonic anhydrase [Roseibium hamelinense]|uniref:Carbonic anhydrase n=1 Tax=Roseibium hamelinense TaxID=150831 RepID=A0A562SF11_9HYPH|nr:carbonic anhydrase [Roseibium hamelinense]MTI42136.1 carbonic anhydrase [Roseibium hamelinense]TWI79947.1 carbonic anhydrase [Roseibium hamelinense]
MTFPPNLLAGYGRYLEKGFVRYRQTHEHLAIYGQQPEVMVISCCDSRVTPEGVFNVGPGELFVVRNVANLVPPFEATDGQHGTSAAIEYAVTALHVKHIVVLGHAKCGGICAFRETVNRDTLDGNFIGRWIKLLEPAAIAMACMPVDRIDDPQLAMEYAGVRQSLKNLLTFPFVRDAVEAGNLDLHGAWFDIGSGELRTMDPDTLRFAQAGTETQQPLPVVAAE